jgi:catechol 2,3-dioxygenase-like lactoylglutathione lyase family enzyme
MAAGLNTAQRISSLSEARCRSEKMLSKLDSHTMIAVVDLERAKRFYEERLGLAGIEEIPGLWVFAGPRGSRFCLFVSPLAGTAKNAVMGWETSQIAEEVHQLKARGVVFEEYDFPNFKTVDSIVTSATGKSAWFKDTEGNMLGLAQWKS